MGECKFYTVNSAKFTEEARPEMASARSVRKFLVKTQVLSNVHNCRPGSTGRPGLRNVSSQRNCSRCTRSAKDKFVLIKKINKQLIIKSIKFESVAGGRPEVPAADSSAI